ncbi:hypothetical protein [Azotobacter vinelandii]|uniref:hypothetical protein n=1 Tax=Azotobacter vinelandii TaxID=354 RepID=UPI00091C4A88|nr:hypothetical protein [Azotobacter vinelandii]WKN23210.1 hypothetical protein AVAEIV_001247 [Azotobacter vinelandii]SFY07881.1 hypothetical protein SAMN04244547_03886 [Azotobacter vinelandii]
MASLRRLKKSLRALAELASTEGWMLQRTRGGHLRFSKPGCAPIFMSSTPSDHRAFLNARAQLRQSRHATVPDQEAEHAH